MRKGTETTK